MLNVGGKPWIEAESALCGSDFAAFLRSIDLTPTVQLDQFGREKSVSNWARFASGLDEPLENVGLHSPNGTSKQLDLLLNELDGRVTPTCGLVVDGFRITSEQFRRLTAQFEHVSFVRCHFGKGWWLSGPNRKCQSLTLDSCTGACPGKPTVGGASWSALSFLGVHGPGRPVALRRRGISPVDPANRDLTETIARDAVAALWSETLEDISVINLGSIEFFPSLPNCKSLRSMCLISPVSPRILEWVAGNSNLTRLDLLWRPGVRLPWGTLKRLRRLNYLDVSDSPFDDADLKAVVQFSKLRTLMAYSTKLTPASWPVVLSWPGLRSFSGATEMSGGEEPEGLPETTRLKEFVAMNARTEWFEQLLSRYPNVRIFRM